MALESFMLRFLKSYVSADTLELTENCYSISIDGRLNLHFIEIDSFSFILACEWTEFGGELLKDQKIPMRLLEKNWDVNRSIFPLHWCITPEKHLACVSIFREFENVRDQLDVVLEFLLSVECEKTIQSELANN
jgi:hypothetical protein